MQKIKHIVSETASVPHPHLGNWAHYIELLAVSE
jgi:hypothetical protein